ncbi:hypothetical protein XENOCAPTIV_024188 [Xenoophorus captivus]|uniref:Uncharacterized protein n=1 Tax=Xenoophorus captivus TaxID=1517983 RepID=A0ABV0RV06_9TELE
MQDVNNDVLVDWLQVRVHKSSGLRDGALHSPKKTQTTCSFRRKPRTSELFVATHVPAMNFYDTYDSMLLACEFVVKYFSLGLGGTLRFGVKVSDSSELCPEISVFHSNVKPDFQSCSGKH